MSQALKREAHCESCRGFPDLLVLNPSVILILRKVKNQDTSTCHILREELTPSFPLAEAITHKRQVAGSQWVVQKPL